MNFRLFFCTLILQSSTFNPATLSAQASEVAEKRPPQYIRLDIENDMLIPRSKTDRYFSSGLKLDYTVLSNPHKKPFLKKIFPKLENANNYYGYTIATNMFTPANKSENIIVGDRPYCGWAYLGLTGTSNDYIKATKISTEYTIGAIGPITQQEFMQTQFHSLIGRPKPQGWKNQIANDIAINIAFTGEKRFTQLSENVDVIAAIEANVGSVNNFIGMGGLIRIGWFEDYFRNIMQVKGRNNWQLFAFARPVIRVVADNSLLQGGMFTYSQSPYVIPKDDINHVYMNAEIGYSLTFRSFNITYSQNIRSPEFANAKNMFWGAMAFSYGF